MDISSREIEKEQEESETLLNEQAEEFRSELEKAKEDMGTLETERDTLSSQVFVLEEQVNDLNPHVIVLSLDMASQIGDLRHEVRYNFRLR